MITIQVRQLTRVSEREAVKLLESFTGRDAAFPGRVGATALDGIVEVPDILDRFYNGGAFQAIRSVALGRNGREDRDDTGTYHATRYPFTEPARPGRTAGTRIYYTQGGTELRSETRSYAARYYPNSERVTGESHYANGFAPGEPVYRIAVTPSGLSYAEQDNQLAEPTTPSQIKAAGAVLLRFAYDVARDTASL